MQFSEADLAATIVRYHHGKSLKLHVFTMKEIDWMAIEKQLFGDGIRFDSYFRREDSNVTTTL